MKLLRSIVLWLTLTCLMGRLAAYAQGVRTDAGQGLPPARLFLPSQYDGHSQNFALTQDRRGVLYVGNFAGVLEYDGINWRTIPTRNITKVSALLTARSGTIYVGGNGEFGYLRPDSTGRLVFASLSQRAKLRFGEVLSVLEGKDGFYFVTRNGLFRWNGKRLSEWPSPTPIRSAFTSNQTVFVARQSTGLSVFQEGTFTPVDRPGNKSIRIDNVVAALPLDGSQSLLVTGNQGLFRCTGTTVEPIKSPASGYLTATQATGAAQLTDRSVAISTARGEVLVLAPDGAIRQLIREIGGLRDQLVNTLFADREGNLWLALNNGIAQLEIPSPITLFTESARLTGEVIDIRRVNGVVYLATINGLFTIDNQSVRPVAGLNVGCFALTEAGGSLFVASSQGVYQLTDGRAQLVTSNYSLSILTSERNPSRVYVGTETGLGVLTLAGRRVAGYQTISGLNERIFGLAEDSDGNLWLETLTAGLYQFSAATGRPARYADGQGLPTPLYNRVTNTTQGLLAYNEKGIFRFVPQSNRFVAYDPFRSRQSTATDWKNNIVEDGQRNLWTIEGTKDRITFYKKQSANFQAITAPFLPIARSPINVIYPDQQGIVWFGGRDGVVRYNPGVQKVYARPYQALIRQILTTDERALFNGYGLPANRQDTSDADIPTLPYASSDISFEFSAASYPVDNALTFSYKLEDYDKTWSDSTSTKTKKEYTNLPPGWYRFRVKARNSYDVPSQEAVYAFRVLPPWYGRWWVITLLVILAGLLIYWIVRWRLNLLVREKQALETLIRERTEEIVFQKEELEKQSEELADKNDQLEKIDLIVQSINSEIDFANLFQTILTKFSVIRNIDSASFLVYDKATDTFRFKALRSNRDLAHVESVQLTQEQVETRLLAGASEAYEDIYRKDDVHYEPLNSPIDDLVTPRSLLTIVIKNEGRIEGLITLENQARSYAFDQRDLNMIRNLKEHLIAAFIKTRLLEDLENTLNDLKSTQDELIRQERLASVGQLIKGIVDRILNPLNYVTNFSQLSDGLIDDLLLILDRQKDLLPTDDLDDLLDDAGSLKANLTKIREHSNSTTRIMKDMQRLLMEKSRDFLETDLNTFIESKARTALQETKDHYKDFAINLVLNLENKPIRTKLLPHEFGQVLQNMMSNSFYTLYEKSKSANGFQPEVRIVTQAVNGQVLVRFRDNGKGIPQREIEKLFSPFFTTKPTADGTGLGLFMIKDIVETHRGKIEINSVEGEFTEVTMTLPTLT